MKKVLSILLTAVMLLSLTAGLDFSAYAFENSGSIGPDATYAFDPSTKTLTNSGTGETYNASTYDANFEDFGIKTAIIEEGITRIGSSLFNNCTDLESVTIPSTVSEIGSNAFAYCEKLESVTIPDGVKKLVTNVFLNCKSLKTVELPSTLERIGYMAFSYCESLVSVDIPASVTSIGSYAFNECFSLENVTIPGSVHLIDYCAFADCSSLKEIIIPEGVTTIESRAFLGCSSAKTLKIPSTATYIHNYAFMSCGALEKITVASANTDFDSRNDCNALIKTGENKIIRGCKNTKIPSDVKIIGSYSFNAVKGLKSVNITKGVTSIYESAFYNCSDLESVKFPNTLKTINNLAFYKTALKSVNIPENLKKLEVSAFVECKKLTKFTVNSKNKYFSAKNGVLFNKKKTKLLKYPEGKSNTKYTVPKSVKTLGYSSFSNSKKLKKVTLKKGLTAIGDSAFTDCKKLNKLVIPSGVKTIGNDALVGCTSLKEITLPKTIKEYPVTCFSLDYSDNDAYKKYAVRTINFKGTIKELGKRKMVDDLGDGPEVSYPLAKGLAKAKFFCSNGMVYNDHKCYEKNAKITKQPTFKATGKKVYKCSHCSKKFTVTLPKLGKPSLSKLTKGKKSFTAKWAKVTGVGGYQIQYSVYKNMKNAKKVKVKGTKKTVKKLKSGKKYFVRIRAYKKINGKTKYSAWSAKKTVTTKK